MHLMAASYYCMSVNAFICLKLVADTAGVVEFGGIISTICQSSTPPLKLIHDSRGRIEASKNLHQSNSHSHQ